MRQTSLFDDALPASSGGSLTVLGIVGSTSALT